MHMAMYDQPQLPTPYPVGVNGLGVANSGIGKPRPPQSAPQPAPNQNWWSDTWTSIWSALPVVGGADFIQSYTGPDIPNARYAAWNKAHPTDLTAIYNSSAHDPQHDSQNMIKDFTGIDSAPLAWITNNWKWIALLGGGVILVKHLSKRS